MRMSTVRNHWTLLLVAIIILTAGWAYAGGCPSDCSNHGYCEVTGEEPSRLEALFSFRDTKTYKCICYFVWEGTACDKQRNLAKGQPTMQSYTLQGGESYYAVDGNKDPDAVGGRSCAIAAKPFNNYNPHFRVWWSVDLSIWLELDKVKLVNRRDCCWGRLKDFVIGTTDVSASARTPTLNTIRICHSQSEPLGRGEERSIPCKETGSNVVIYMLQEYSVLTLCEVEVYGSTIY